MSTDSPQDSPAWWNKARAALGRAFGTVQVRRWEPDASAPQAGTRTSDATRWPLPGTGTGERDWPLAAATHVWQPPSAASGGGGMDAAALACIASGNAVPSLGAQGVHSGQVSVTSPPVHEARRQTGAADAVVVLPYSLGLSGGQALPAAVALPLPPVRAVSVALAGTGRGTSKPHGRTGVPAFAAPRTASRLDRITRVPLLRRRAALPANADIEGSFQAERRALAAACGATVEEVKLLASFAQIPLALVQQMAVTADGESLRLWLRPEALAAGAGWTAARVTVVVGRRRGTGEAIRAVLPEARVAGRKQ